MKSETNRLRTLAENVGRQLRTALYAPLFPSAASRLSESIDRAGETGQMESPGDPAVTAVLKAAAPGLGLKPAMPPGLQERSWKALEAELFSTPATEPSLSLPYRDRRGPSLIRVLLTRVPRIAYAGAVLVILGGSFAAWRAPTLLARPIVRQVAQEWSQTRTYDADLQFASFIPGKQMQWSGRQIYGGSDQMLLQIDLMGVPAALVVHGRLASMEMSQAVINDGARARLRFLVGAVRPGGVIEALANSPRPRFEGTAIVLGRRCRVIWFPVDGMEGDRMGAAEQILENAVPGIRAGRVWISGDLPVQAELYGPGGAIAVAYRFTHFTRNPRLRPGIFEVPRHHIPVKVVRIQTIILSGAR